MKIGYLGPKGTFSHKAAMEFAATKKEHELVAFNYIGDCLEAANTKDVNFAVVPFENSIEGTVTFTIDSLIFDVDVIIEQEIILPITHNLAVKNGTKKEDITKILSHPQALAQCKRYLDKNFYGIERIQVSSTAEAGKIVCQSNECLAAICMKEAAEDFGLTLLDEGIQDEVLNKTRFLVVSKDGPALQKNEGKTSIVFGTGHEPGSLYRILDILAIWDLNMSKIESRPRKNELGKYVFYIDMESSNAADIRDALKMIERKTSFFKHLGTYHTL